MDLPQLLKMIATPGDLAAVLLGYVAGFAVDVNLFPLGIPPGTTALLSAAGTLGAKKGVQASIQARRRAEPDSLILPAGSPSLPLTPSSNAPRLLPGSSSLPVAPRKDLLKKRVESLLTILPKGLRNERERLQIDAQLWESELITSEAMQQTLDHIVRLYRARIVEKIERAGRVWELIDVREADSEWEAVWRAIEEPDSTITVPAAGPDRVKAETLEDAFDEIKKRTFTYVGRRWNVYPNGLAPDGTFRLRFVGPSGEEFVATSAEHLSSIGDHQLWLFVNKMLRP
jgi:hypothetical protein